jgi:hypothetical protein
MLLEFLFEKAANLANHVASFMPSRKAKNGNRLSFAEIPADLFFMLLEHMDYQ